MIKIDFRCFNCDHVFDQSGQDYKGIRVIGKKFKCPNCNTDVLVSKEGTVKDRKFDQINFFACILFFILFFLRYYIENPKIVDIFTVFLIIFVIAPLTLRKRFMACVRVKKGEYTTLKTEPIK